MENKRIEVEIFGERIFLVSSDDELYLRDIAKYVNEKMVEIFRFRKIQGEKPVISSMLLGLNIADELFKEKEKNAQLLESQTKMEKTGPGTDSDDKKLIDDEKVNLINEIRLIKEENARLEEENKKLRHDLNKKSEELSALQKEFDEYIETFGMDDKEK